MTSWQEWEAAATAQAEVVKSLKGAKAEKEEITAAVAELMHRKEQLKTALEAAIAAETDEAKKAELTAKLPPPPKLSNSDKKKDKKKGGGDADAEKAANIKAMEDAKAAARAKKKAEKDAGTQGGEKGKPAEKPAASAPAGAKESATKAPAGAPPAPKAVSPPAAAPAMTAKKVEVNKTMEIWFLKDAPPKLALLASRLAKIEVVQKKVDAKQLPIGASCMLVLPGNKARICSETAAARYLARAALPAPSQLYGTPGSALSAAEVDHWIERAGTVLATAGKPDLATLLAELNRHLAMRLAFAGPLVGLADAAVWLAIRSNAAGATKLVLSSGPHLARWWKMVDSNPAMQAVAQQLFGVHKDAGSMEIPLPGAEMGQVVTRFPPEPSGHLHIGHVKAITLNAYFAEKYQGKMLLRFDDTNPSKEKGEYEDAILEDLKRLNITPASISHTSDWFEKILTIQTKMLEDGLAYVDPSPQEEQKELRFNKKEGPARSHTIEENLRLWKEMQQGSEEGQKCCVRAKIDMQSDNGAMRDPATYRCNLTPHHATKDKYKVYPTYDLACPIVDSLEGVTHALRDRQYSDRNPQFDWFISALKLRPVHLWGFSRINFVKTLLSKRKLQWLIDEGRADDWDDPRFPTVSGVLRRGMTVQGLKTFILSMGASKNVCLMEWDKIWAVNKGVIDPTSARYTALLSKNLVPFRITGGAGAPTEAYASSIVKHPKDESMGTKIRFFGPDLLLQADDAAGLSVGEEVTLMSWGNVIITGLELDAQGELAGITADLNLAGSVKSTKKKFTWLAATPDLVDIELVDLDFLLNKDKVEESDDIEKILTQTSRFVDAAKGEAALRQLQKGEVVQIERRGYYICDRPFVRPGEPITLLFVPDGKSGMGVKR